jgi:hypothetical protein
MSDAENEFMMSKLALENVSDDKKRIEIYSQFKKARAKLMCI